MIEAALEKRYFGGSFCESIAPNRENQCLDTLLGILLFGCVRAQVFSSRGTSAISLKSRFFSAEFSVI